MQRALTKDTIVIVDGLNYIKGYRYQMYCAARELSLRVATVSRHDLCPVNLRQQHKLEDSCSPSVGLRRGHTGTMPRMACATHPGAGVHAFDVSSTRIRQSHLLLATKPLLCGATGSTTSFSGSKSRRQWSDGIRHYSPSPGTRNCLSVTSGKLLRLDLSSLLMRVRLRYVSLPTSPRRPSLIVQHRSPSRLQMHFKRLSRHPTPSFP